MNYPKLKPEIKSKWLIDLRSGNYNQTRNTLKESTYDDSFGYCCLGVFCERENVFSYKNIDNGDWQFRFYKTERSDVPTKRWFEKFFIGEKLTKKNYDRIIEQLTDMNDDSLLSFINIADWIEENL